MYDPLDRKHNAYELLGLTHDADRKQVDKAYDLTRRRKDVNRQELSHAWHKLRKPATRLEEDFWAYKLEGAQAPAAETGPEERFSLEPEFPGELMEVGLPMTDLVAGLYRRDFGEFHARKVELTRSRRYATDPVQALWPEFDR